MSQIKADQVEQQINRLDKWRSEMSSRHAQLRQEARTLNTNNLLMRREQLQQAKMQFLEELARRDSLWQNKMTSVREQELQRTEEINLDVDRQVEARK